jgi:hypothetical protein
VVCILERLPQNGGVAGQPIAGVEGLRHIEAREAPGGPLGIGGLVVTIEARCDILGVADAGEGKFFDHETRDDLRLVRNLECRLLCKQFLLSNEKREKFDLLTIERVVHVPQPFALVLLMTTFISSSHALTNTTQPSTPSASTLADNVTFSRARRRSMNGLRCSDGFTPDRYQSSMHR